MSAPFRSAPPRGAVPGSCPCPGAGTGGHGGALCGAARCRSEGGGGGCSPAGSVPLPALLAVPRARGIHFLPPPPPPSPRRVSKEPCKFSSLAPSAQSPVANKLRLLSPPLSRCPLRGGGRGAGGGGGGGRAGGERQRSVGGGAAPCEPRQRHLSSAAQRRAEPLRCRPGRAGPSGRRGGLSCGGPGAPAVPLPSCQAGFYGNIDRIKVPCNSVINGVSLVSKMKCGAVKLFIWKVILRNLTSDTWSYIKPAS